MNSSLKTYIMTKDEKVVEKIKNILKELEYFELDTCIFSDKINKKQIKEIDCDLLIIDSNLIDEPLSLKTIMKFFNNYESKDIPYVIYLRDETLSEYLKNLQIPYVNEDWSIDEAQNVLLKQIVNQKLYECTIKNLKLESLSIFTGGAAHDFNNIMGTIMGYSELLKHKAKDNPDALKYLDYILSSCVKAQALIEILTNLSRNWKRQKRFKIPLHIILKETIRDLQNRYHIGKTIFEDIIKEDDIIDAEPSKLYLLCHILVKNIMELNNGDSPLKIALNVVDCPEKLIDIKDKSKGCLELKILGKFDKDLLISTMEKHKKQIEDILDELKGSFEYWECDKEIGVKVIIPKIN